MQEVCEEPNEIQRFKLRMQERCETVNKKNLMGGLSTTTLEGNKSRRSISADE